MRNIADLCTDEIDFTEEFFKIYKEIPTISNYSISQLCMEDSRLL